LADQNSYSRGRLYRSNRERVLAGIAGGLAEYFNVDPTLIRLVWVISAFVGFGILAYIVAWVIIPEAPTGSYRYDRYADRASSTAPTGGAATDTSEADRPSAGPAAQDPESRPAGAFRGHGFILDDHEFRSVGAPWLLGLVLVALGGFLLIRNFVPLLHWIPFWPILIILVGILVMTGAFRHEPRERNDKR